MLVQVIEGFNDKIQQALQAGNYDELRLLDAACLRFMSENLPPRDLDNAALLAVNDSLDRLRSTYRLAVQACTAARDAAAQELQQAGRGRRNTHQYLDVARQFGS